jgi:transcriptional regulator with XRE-family HTH domain
MHSHCMTLSEFLTSQNMTDAQFASLVDRDRSTVTRWRNGATRPDWKAIDAIATATGGKVSVLDFFPTQKGQGHAVSNA